MTKEEIAADRAVCDARTFPIQTQRGAKPHPLLIPWSVAELAYSVYAGRYGRDQSLKRLAERGGFGPNEMDMFLPDWRARCDEIVRLRAENAALRAQIAGHAERIAGQSELLSRKAEK
jgi:hypothetical protein